MNTKLRAAPKTKYHFNLVKWDGDAPPDWKQIEHPEQHPKCLEVLEWELGQPAKTIYQRES